MTKKMGCLTSEDAFLYIAKKEIDIFFRIFLKILPNIVAKLFLEKLINRSLLQFDAQNQFIANNLDVIRNYFYSLPFNAASQEDKALIVGNFLANASIYEIVSRHYKYNFPIFFDEGFLQKIIVFAECDTLGSDILDRCFKYLQSIPMPDLSIFIKYDYKLCYERMLARPKGLPKRLKGKSKNEIESKFSKIDAFFQKLQFGLKKIQLLKY